jgi:branched-chain amino acid transport system permease protein
MRLAGAVGIVIALALPLTLVPGSPAIGPQLAWTADAPSTSLATFALVFALVALAFGTLVRLSGLPSVAYGALWGVGAYTAGALTTHWGWDFAATLVPAILVPALVAVLIGIPALRTSGIAFLVITIVLGEFLVLVITNSDAVTGGPQGLLIVGQSMRIGPIDLADTRQRYYVAVAFLYAGMLASWLVVRSRFGRRLELLRDEELLARSIGLDPWRYRLAILAFTAGLAGAAGQLYLYQLQAVEPGLFAAYAFIPLILAAILGGTGSIAGPVIGAYVVAYLPTWFGRAGVDDPNTQTLVYGVLLIVAIIVAPTGLAGLAKALRRRWPLHPPAELARVSLIPTPETGRISTPESAVTTPVAGSGGGAPLLRVTGLRKQYGALLALDGVDLVVHAGEILGVIGPNGSGKTTLFNCISGFATAQGTIEFRGRQVRHPAPHRLAADGLVRTFQQPLSFTSRTPRQACAEVQMLVRRHDDLGLPRDPDALLALCGLADVATVALPELSYGRLRLLGVAVALASRPNLLMLDEPAAGLDDDESHALRTVLEATRAAGVTLAVVDHDMAFLLPLCDRVVVLDAGSVVTEGRPDEVTRDPHVIAAYLGEDFAAASDLVGERR